MPIILFSPSILATPGSKSGCFAVWRARACRSRNEFCRSKATGRRSSKIGGWLAAISRRAESRHFSVGAGISLTALVHRQREPARRDAADRLARASSAGRSRDAAFGRRSAARRAIGTAGHGGHRSAGRCRGGQPAARIRTRRRRSSMSARRSRSIWFRGTALFWAARFCRAWPCLPERCTNSPICCRSSKRPISTNRRRLWELARRKPCARACFGARSARSAN